MLMENWNLTRQSVLSRLRFRKQKFAKSEEKMIVHCNFGWNGLFNGYYVSGIFALKDGEWDTRGNDYDKTKYNNYLKIITYDSPR